MMATAVPITLSLKRCKSMQLFSLHIFKWAEKTMIHRLHLPQGSTPSPTLSLPPFQFQVFDSNQTWLALENRPYFTSKQHPLHRIVLIWLIMNSLVVFRTEPLLCCWFCPSRSWFKIQESRGSVRFYWFLLRYWEAVVLGWVFSCFLWWKRMKKMHRRLNEQICMII